MICAARFTFVGRFVANAECEKTWKGSLMRLIFLATILALSSTVAMAEDKDMMEMGQGLTMLQVSSALVLKQHGFDVDVMTLTLSQLAEIQAVMTASNDAAEMKARIEAGLRK